MAARVDLAGIKTQIKSILDSANTTTGSPIDLSSGLSQSTRVQKVLKVHPEMIPIQASYYPFVTCYITGKDIQKMDMAGSQLNAKRKAVVEIDVVGAVWQPTFSSDTEDPADEDINYLMENIELILRSAGAETLNAKVNWQVADRVSYYSYPLNESNHLRAGILPLRATVFY